MIRPATDRDAEAIARIYNHYIVNTIVTFEEQAISSSEMANRMELTARASFPWLIAEEKGRVVGYASAGLWKQRHGYRFSAESTVYLDPLSSGRGFGTALYKELLVILRDESVHIVIGGVALPNVASVALHEKFGFRKVAHFIEVGFKFNRWIDVGYWQLSL